MAASGMEPLNTSALLAADQLLKKREKDRLSQQRKRQRGKELERAHSALLAEKDAWEAEKAAMENQGSSTGDLKAERARQEEERAQWQLQEVTLRSQCDVLRGENGVLKAEISRLHEHMKRQDDRLAGSTTEAASESTSSKPWRVLRDEFLKPERFRTSDWLTLYFKHVVESPLNPTNLYRDGQAGPVTINLSYLQYHEWKYAIESHYGIVAWDLLAPYEAEGVIAVRSDEPASRPMLFIPSMSTPISARLGAFAPRLELVDQDEGKDDNLLGVDFTKFPMTNTVPTNGLFKLRHDFFSLGDGFIRPTIAEFFGYSSDAAYAALATNSFTEAEARSVFNKLSLATLTGKEATAETSDMHLPVATTMPGFPAASSVGGPRFSLSKGVTMVPCQRSDRGLGFISTQVAGCTRLWLVISPADAHRLEYTLQNFNVPLTSVHNASCPQRVRAMSVVVTPRFLDDNGFDYRLIRQAPGTSVFIASNAYYCVLQSGDGITATVTCFGPRPPTDVGCICNPGGVSFINSGVRM